MASEQPPEVGADVTTARALARATDTAFRIPGTQVRFGLDALLGLIPGFGDVGGALISGYVLLVGARRRVPPLTLFRMLGNIGVEALLGMIPAVGDLFDVGWKANVRNVALLEDHLADEAAARRSSVVVMGSVFVGFLAIVAATAWVSIRMLAWILVAVT